MRSSCARRQQKLCRVYGEIPMAGERVIALEPRGKGMMGITIGTLTKCGTKREKEFDDLEDEKITKEMMDLASHIVKTKQGHFQPDKYEDRYEEALKDLLKKKAAGKKIGRVEHEEPTNVVNLMDSLVPALRADQLRSAESRRALIRALPRKQADLPLDTAKLPAKVYENQI